MYYLYQRGDSHGFIVEATYQGTLENFPRYYAGRWDEFYPLKSDYDATQLKEDLKKTSVQPNYVIFLSDIQLDSRIEKFKKSYPQITLLKAIEPSYIDRLFHWLNPVNENEPCYVYSLKQPTD